MAEDRKRMITTSDLLNTAKESRTSSPVRKSDACKGKKRAVTNEPQDGTGSSKVERGRERGVKRSGTENLDHGAHIQTERDRRKRMQDMFSSLQAFHPHLPPKIDKATVVEETVNYIKTLEQTLESLEKQKLDRIRSTALINQKPPSAASSSVISPEHSITKEAFLAEQVGKVPSPLDMVMPLPPGQSCFNIQTWTSPNVVLSIIGTDAYITMCVPKRSGLITATAHFLEKYSAEALTVQAYSDEVRTMFIMFARANEATGRFSETLLPPEERFKLALGEMILWLSSSN